MQKPTVTIVIPLHNKGSYINETISSVRAQTVHDWEIIVVENHSSDSGPEQVKDLAKVDSRVNFLQASASIRGPGAARNLGLSLAQGQWVLFLDADDLITTNHLESMLMVGGETGADVVASDWIEVVDGHWKWDSQGITNDPTVYGISLHHASGSLDPPPRISVQDSSIAYAPWAVHCGLIRRAALKAPRYWVESLDKNPSEDTAFWFRTLLDRKVAYTRLATAIYRIETPNFRNTHRDLIRWADAMAAIHSVNVDFLHKYDREINSCHAECLMQVWSKIGFECWRQGFKDLSSTAYCRAENWKRFAGWDSRAKIMRRLLGCRIVDRIIHAL